MTAAVEHIGTYELPREVVERSCGFSIDIGGSVVKITYRTKEDYDAMINDKDKKTATVRLVSVARTDLEGALNFIEKNCHIVHKEEGETLAFATGVGSNMFNETIRQRFNVKLEVLTEFDCFVKSFTYLCRHVPRSEFLADPYEEGLKKADKLTAVLSAKVKQMSQFTEIKFDGNKTADDMKEPAQSSGKAVSTDTRPYAETVTDLFPCLLIMCGSGAGYILVNEDGSFAIVDGSNRSGRMFLGLGTILTGKQSFEELMSLAEKGNNKNLDVYMGDMVKTGKADMYSSFASEEDEPDHLVYCFGKGVEHDAEHFKKEDVMSSLLNMMLLDQVQLTFQNAMANKVKRVFFCGSFMNSDHTRNIVSEHLATKINFAKMMAPESTQGEMTFEFVNGGSHLGSLGAFMHVPQPKAADAPAETPAQ